MLEDRRRVLSNLQKERARRFLPLIKDLAEEEPEILAALVNSIYHESLHQTSGPEIEPPERLEKPASPRGGDGGRRKRSEERRVGKESTVGGSREDREDRNNENQERCKG